MSRLEEQEKLDTAAGDLNKGPTGNPQGALTNIFELSANFSIENVEAVFYSEKKRKIFGCKANGLSIAVKKYELECFGKVGVKSFDLVDHECQDEYLTHIITTSKEVSVTERLNLTFNNLKEEHLKHSFRKKSDGAGSYSGSSSLVQNSGGKSRVPSPLPLKKEKHLLCINFHTQEKRSLTYDNVAIKLIIKFGYFFVHLRPTVLQRLILL
jgi:hypothetical protein